MPIVFQSLRVNMSRRQRGRVWGRVCSSLRTSVNMRVLKTLREQYRFEPRINLSEMHLLRRVRRASREFQRRVPFERFSQFQRLSPFQVNSLFSFADVYCRYTCQLGNVIHNFLVFNIKEPMALYWALHTSISFDIT